MIVNNFLVVALLVVVSNVWAYLAIMFLLRVRERFRSNPMKSKLVSILLVAAGYAIGFWWSLVISQGHS